MGCSSSIRSHNQIFEGNKIKYLWSHCVHCKRQGHLGHFVTLGSFNRSPKCHWLMTQTCVHCKYPLDQCYKSKSLAMDKLVLKEWKSYLFEYMEHKGQTYYLFINVHKGSFFWYCPTLSMSIEFYKELFHCRHQFIQNEKYYQFHKKTMNVNMSVASISRNNKSYVEGKPTLYKDYKYYDYKLKETWDYCKKYYNTNTKGKDITYERYYNGCNSHANGVVPAGITHFKQVFTPSSCKYLNDVCQILLHKVTHDYDFLQQFGDSFHNLCKLTKGSTETKKVWALDLDKANHLTFKIHVNYQYLITQGQDKNDIITRTSPCGLVDLEHYGLKLATKIIHHNFGSCVSQVSQDNNGIINNDYRNIHFNAYQFMIYNHFNSQTFGLQFHKDNYGLLNNMAMIPCAHIHGKGGVSFSTLYKDVTIKMKDLSMKQIMDPNAIHSRIGLFKNVGDCYVMHNEVVNYYEHAVINPAKIGNILNQRAIVSGKDFEVIKKKIKLLNERLRKLKKIPNEEEYFAAPQSVSIVGRTFRVCS